MNVSPIEIESVGRHAPNRLILSVVNLYANFIRNNPQLMTQNNYECANAAATECAPAY